MNACHSEMLTRLDGLLAAHDWLWRPQPFKEARPGWCAQLPALAAELLALDDAEVQRLNDDDVALIGLLSRHLPGLHELAALMELPQRSGPTLAPASPQVQRDIPGRKWAQIEAFAQAVGEVQAPVLEWCGGKGHLGRLLAVQHGQAVATLELDAELCGAGQVLARRAQASQSFIQADVLEAAAATHLPGRHVVALHACGDLHRSLVRRAVEQAVPALDIAPCCYYRSADKTYRPWSGQASLVLNRDDLRLAVTETVTSAPREVRQRDTDMAWKLGYDQLRREVSGEDRYQPFKPVARDWLKLGFEGYARALAAREGLALPASPDWGRHEQAGWLRQREVMRLSLVRHAFRRPLEIWLVLDLAGHLAAHGYRVELGTFCPRQVTPRNILLSARA